MNLPLVRQAAASLTGCLHPPEYRSAAHHGSEPTTLVICQLCGACSRTNGRLWSRPSLVVTLEGVLREDVQQQPSPGNPGNASLRELLSAVREVLAAKSAAAEARAIERLREAARAPLTDGSTLLDATLEAIEAIAKDGAS
jgi:hypothetical protein